MGTTRPPLHNAPNDHANSTIPTLHPATAPALGAPFPRPSMTPTSCSCLCGRFAGHPFASQPSSTLCQEYALPALLFVPCATCTPTLPYGSGGGWSRGSAQLGVPLGGPGEWLGVVRRVLLARWRLGASFRGVVWGALTVSVVAAGVRCGRRCRCDAGSLGASGVQLWRVGALFSSSRGSRGFTLLVPVHMGCAVLGGCRLAGCYRLLCVVFPVLCMCAATYSVHALQFLLEFRLLLCYS